MSFKHIFHAGQAMIRNTKKENAISQLFHSPLIIPRVPATLSMIKCERGLAKDFTNSQDSLTRSYEENIKEKMHQVTDFDWDWLMIRVSRLAARGDLAHDNLVAKCDVKANQTPHVFSDSSGRLIDYEFKKK